MTVHDLGVLPPVGDVPDQMLASIIRPERYGEPKDAFRTEVVDVPDVGPRQVLVYVMAAGINYNNVWAARATPVDVVAARRRKGSELDYHIGGSDASGIVWAVGDDVTGVAPGDHVILSSCRWDETAPDIRMGRDPMMSTTQSVWGYEDNYGSFAQYALVDAVQCHPKPPNLSWELAASILVSAATAYHQLCHWTPNVVGPGDPVLVWGGAGGLGSMAIQIVRIRGGRPVAVVSDPERAEFCRRLGATGTIDRSGFDHWGRLPDTDDEEAFAGWLAGAQKFTAAFYEALGERRRPRIVFEHSGQGTIPTSMFVCDNGGMVVTCAGTSGYNGDVDLRILWMRQKRLQGSHFASVQDCRAVIELTADGRLDPCLAWCGGFEEIGYAHQLMADNAQPPGNLAVLVGAPETGMTSESYEL